MSRSGANAPPAPRRGVELDVLAARAHAAPALLARALDTLVVFLDTWAAAAPEQVALEAVTAVTRALTDAGVAGR